MSYVQFEEFYPIVKQLFGLRTTEEHSKSEYHFRLSNFFNNSSDKENDSPQSYPGTNLLLSKQSKQDWTLELANEVQDYACSAGIDLSAVLPSIFRPQSKTSAVKMKATTWNLGKIQTGVGHDEMLAVTAQRLAGCITVAMRWHLQQRGVERLLFIIDDIDMLSSSSLLLIHCLQLLIEKDEKLRSACRFVISRHNVEIARPHMVGKNRRSFYTTSNSLGRMDELRSSREHLYSSDDKPDVSAQGNSYEPSPNRQKGHREGEETTFRRRFHSCGDISHLSDQHKSNEAATRGQIWHPMNSSPVSEFILNDLVEMSQMEEGVNIQLKPLDNSTIISICLHTLGTDRMENSARKAICALADGSCGSAIQASRNFLRTGFLRWSHDHKCIEKSEKAGEDVTRHSMDHLHFSILDALEPTAQLLARLIAVWGIPVDSSMLQMFDLLEDLSTVAASEDKGDPNLSLVVTQHLSRSPKITESKESINGRPTGTRLRKRTSRSTKAKHRRSSFAAGLKGTTAKFDAELKLLVERGVLQAERSTGNTFYCYMSESLRKTVYFSMLHSQRKRTHQHLSHYYRKKHYLSKMEGRVGTRDIVIFHSERSGDYVTVFAALWEGAKLAISVGKKWEAISYYLRVLRCIETHEAISEAYAHVFSPAEMRLELRIRIAALKLYVQLPGDALPFLETILKQDRATLEKIPRRSMCVCFGSSFMSLRKIQRVHNFLVQHVNSTAKKPQVEQTALRRNLAPVAVDKDLVSQARILWSPSSQQCASVRKNCPSFGSLYV